MAILGVKGGTDGLPNMIITETETWAPNKTIQAYVYCIGGGGSGAGGGGNANYGFSGGGAAGCAVSLLTLTAGVTYTATIGAGGAASGGASQAAGNAGNNTTFNGSDIDIMTGSAGSAGAIASGASASSASGGSASGGNLMNNTGGASLASGATRQVSGGGAVGLWDTGRQGTTVASSNDWADGGNLSGGPNGSYPTSTRYADNTVVAGAPFPEVYSVTSGISRSGTSATIFDSNPSFQPAGVQPYNYLGEDVAWTSNTRAYVAPPFSGGNGYITNQDTYVYGSHASLGGGGGAVLGTAGGSEGYSGRGGNGAVLIFPIAIG
jgi:hypothetical protein